jgi:hypothetical protein
MNNNINVGTGVTFDGVDDWVDLADVPLGAPGYTISAWARWHSFKSWSRVIEFGTGTSSANNQIIL